MYLLCLAAIAITLFFTRPTAEPRPPVKWGGLSHSFHAGPVRVFFFAIYIENKNGPIKVMLNG